MTNLKEVALEAVNVKWLTQFIILSAVAIGLPFVINNQVITGPLVNAILILALFFTGLRSALLIACLPSMIALGSGLLPIALAPAIPIIIISNIIFVLVIHFIYKNTKEDSNAYWLSVLPAASLKFLFLAISINFLVTFFIHDNLVDVVSKMMGYMQFANALAGSLIAYLILKSSIIKKYVKNFSDDFYFGDR